MFRKDKQVVKKSVSCIKGCKNNKMENKIRIVSNTPGTNGRFRNERHIQEKLEETAKK